MQADAAVVEKLKAAGAIIVGKTNSPEIGLWPFTEGPAFGITRNPWSLDHSPGGSSGGSAAAVSAGLLPAAVGSDGAGSVRIPAAWTNLVGIKPQRGRISTMPDPEAFLGLTVNGPLARTVGDAALLLDVLSGGVDGDRHAPPAPREPFVSAARQTPGPLRIGLALNIPFSGTPATLDPEVRGAVGRIAGRLEELGHAVETTSLLYGLWTGASIMPRSMAGILEWTERVPDPSVLDRRVREAARVGRILRPLLGAARFAEEIGHRSVGRSFREFDVVLAPTTAQPPLPIGACDGLSGWETDKRIVAACPYAWPWNVLGWPGVNVPAGLTDSGLPLGAQLLGPANSESLLISVAAQLEDAERWHERRPRTVSTMLTRTPSAPKAECESRGGPERVLKVFTSHLADGNIPASAACFTRDACLITADRTEVHGRDGVAGGAGAARRQAHRGRDRPAGRSRGGGRRPRRRALDDALGRTGGLPLRSSK